MAVFVTVLRVALGTKQKGEPQGAASGQLPSSASLCPLQAWGFVFAAFLAISRYGAVQGGPGDQVEGPSLAPSSHF